MVDKMLRLKKFLPIVITIVMTLGINTNAFATENTPKANEPLTGTIQQISTSDFDEAEKIESQKIQEITTDNYSFPQLNVKPNLKLDSQKKSATASNATSEATTNGIWQINDPVFVGDGNLTGSYDLYLVNTSSPKTIFLKLASRSSELLAVLYKVDAQGNLINTGFGAYANGSDNFGVLAAGNYAIAIGSSSGNATGTYTLMWNSSNPSGASSIIDRTSDLSRVVLFYSNNIIRSNGTNIMTDLKWEEHETWYLPLGYSARDMVIDSITSSGTYLGSFTSSKPYTVNNALFIEVSRGSYLYSNSYYRNNEGEVVHVIDYTDPSGLKTPRWLGEAATDFNWGSHYIVIDLDTFQVVEFLSPFNYHYTIEGGRTYSLSNITQID